MPEHNQESDRVAATEARAGTPPGKDDGLVGSPFLKPGSTLRCTGQLHLLTDQVGRTWIVLDTRDEQPGGVMPHLVAGQLVTVESTNSQGLVVRVGLETSPSEVKSDEHVLESFALLPAYLVPAPLLPTFDR